jgi:hypothetical protein
MLRWLTAGCVNWCCCCWLQAGHKVTRVDKTTVAVHVPWLAAAGQQVAALQQRQDLLVSQAMLQAAASFWEGYPCMRALMEAVGALDACAGFAVATAPQTAPAGACCVL